MLTGEALMKLRKIKGGYAMYKDLTDFKAFSSFL